MKNQLIAYNLQSKRCFLCLYEKREILEVKENNLLNKKSKIISKRHHQNKYMLRTLASKIQNPDVTYFYAVIFNVRTFNIVARLKIVFHNLQANEWCYYKHSYIKSNSLFVIEMLCQHLIRPSTTDCKTTTNIYKQSFIK